MMGRKARREELTDDDCPFKIRILRRPSCPSLVGMTGTVFDITGYGEYRTHVHQPPGTKWARTIICGPKEVEILDD